ncbi:glycosyl transferase family 2 [Neolewinella xylanilytica]|uniref:Glycosyl transferase family 2 n=1 Tax=Neolewinella xylanilytica TaxID=1514080 RepID=A0A2S6I8Z9_9BACT|nr:glycosyltransferase family 2 protein [Neolewinella xylanilytica]PPK87976.1 glycosyl transferase family 2 [Neolewinella xylanilytica]
MIIVPVYNEEPAILRRTLKALRGAGARILVVDDGSHPAVEVAVSPDVILLRHSVNLGQGAALETGMAFARKDQFVDILVHFDADGQHFPSDIANLLAPLFKGEADIVFGSRFMRQADRLRIPPMRRLILQLGRIFNRVVTSIQMTDAHIGLRALNRRAFERISLRENRMAYATELLWQVHKHELRWHEVPVAVVYTPYSRAKGQSSWNAFTIVGDIFLRIIYR